LGGSHLISDIRECLIKDVIVGKAGTLDGKVIESFVQYLQQVFLACYTLPYFVFILFSRLKLVLLKELNGAFLDLNTVFLFHINPIPKLLHLFTVALFEVFSDLSIFATNAFLEQLQS